MKNESTTYRIKPDELSDRNNTMDALYPGHQLSWQEQFDIIFRNRVGKSGNKKSPRRFRCRLEELREEIAALKKRNSSNHH